MAMGISVRSGGMVQVLDGVGCRAGLLFCVAVVPWLSCLSLPMVTPSLTWGLPVFSGPLALHYV